MNKGFRHWIFILAGTAVISSFVGCTTGNNGNNTAAGSTQASQHAIGSSLELLNTVWNGYNEDERFYAAGGDVSHNNATEDAPGVYSVSDIDGLDRALGFPADCADKIDNAASLSHMMLANAFTCGVFHLKNPADSSTVTDAVKTNIVQRHWLDGFPDKYVIAVTEDYVVVLWGYDEFVNTFRDKLVSAYPVTEILTDALIE